MWISMKEAVALGEGHNFLFEAFSYNNLQQASATELLNAFGTLTMTSGFGYEAYDWTTQ